MENRPVPEDKTAASITLSKGESVRTENGYFTRKDGSIFPVSCVSSPIVVEGAVTGVVLAFQDITERRNLERQSRDFLAMVSHDLKSPVSVINGYTELLATNKADLLDADSKTMVASIKNNCGKLLNLLNDFLTISRSEAGALPLRQSAEDIMALIAETCSSLSPLAEKKGLAIGTTLQEDIPRASFDKAQLQRAIGNLISNAINYTPSGGSINVSACTSTVGDDRFIVISVTDTGPGISEDEAEKIFEKYYRSRHASGVRGTGLGLAIVRAVAKAHGGNATVENSTPKGATFKVSIPLEIPSTATN
jgi:two-component system sensor histidine kinase VicK